MSERSADAAAADTWWKTASSSSGRSTDADADEDVGVDAAAATDDDDAVAAAEAKKWSASCTSSVAGVESAPSVQTRNENKKMKKIGRPISRISKTKKSKRRISLVLNQNQTKRINSV